MAAKGEPLRGHLELVYPSEYVKAADLKGRDVTIIITDITKEMLVMVGGKKRPQGRDPHACPESRRIARKGAW